MRRQSFTPQTKLWQNLAHLFLCFWWSGFGNASTAKRTRPSKANRGENQITEHNRRWELYAMYKSIWLAAGLKYQPRYEETMVDIQDSERGIVERLTPVEGREHQPPGGNARRLSRALILETTKVYMDQKFETPKDLSTMDKQMKRRWRYTHLAHQYHATHRTAVTDVYYELPPPDNQPDLFGWYRDGGIVDYPCLWRLPTPCPRSAFVTLSNACEYDQALEYQALVVKEIARRAAMFDTHMVAISEPVRLQDVVQPSNCSVYARDETWPLGTHSICCVTQIQHDVLENTYPDEEMPDAHDLEVESQVADEEPIFEDEYDRLETGTTEAEPVDMEVDEEPSRASTIAGVGEGSHRVGTYTDDFQTQSHPEQEQPWALGSDTPGVPIVIKNRTNS
eukprot:2778291-Amphidinium_carterae.2